MTKQRRFILESRLFELESRKIDSSALDRPKQGDFGDEAQRISDQDITTGLLNSQSEEIYRIKVALQNDSDLCVNCEDEISEKRLEARPETTYCLRCQMAEEAGGKYKDYSEGQDGKVYRPNNQYIPRQRYKRRG